MSESERRPRRGRPIDLTINERALEAARELLVEEGFEATTIQAVAARADIHASAIYRRWSSRIDLIEEAVFPGLRPPSVRPTGDLKRDLRKFIKEYDAVLNAPAASAAASGLLSHRQRERRTQPPEIYLRTSARPHFRAILDAAAEGSVDPAVDVDDAFDMLLGAVTIREHLARAAVRRRPLERIVEMMLRLLAPRPD